ncbi:MAG: hypothetical protein KatS3mg028_1573 [Bacteroidia bacterium]|nr:MAG: hypothetical protein KatS3mg028_1573 [Bacteroidia bacterium]
MIKSENPDEYYENGCGRCKKYATSECKVNVWKDKLLEIRKVLSNYELKEEIKWGVPVFTFHGKNIVMLAAFKNYVSLSLFFGSALEDHEKILEKAGENTRHMRILKINHNSNVAQLSENIGKWVNQSIELVKKGKKLPKDAVLPEIPEELTRKFDEMPELKKAFENLTQGKKRGYLLYFQSAKKIETKIKRIEQCIPKIMQGKGLHQ